MRQFVRDRFAGAPVALLSDRDGAVAGQLGFEGYPQFLVVDARGRRVSTIVNSLDAALGLMASSARS